MTADLKGRLRNKGVRFVPNTREQAMAFNRKIQPDVIPEHNDINKIEWTEITSSSAPDFFVGTAALRIPDKSTPRYRLSWPLRYGVFNEKDYKDRHAICRDIVTIIEEALKTQLGLTQRREWKNYDCVVVVPDLYERDYVSTMLEIMFRDFGFSRVCLIQESVSASHGAGYSPCCIVDVGAHKTSICCVEDGMVVENSRVVLRYGSADVTEAFIKMMLTSDFPYADLNLRRRYDFLLAEELKQKFCTLAYVELAHGSRQFEFLLRAPDQDTRHYKFKCYDEVMLSSMVIFPSYL
jgi:actin-related protein 8